MAASVLLLLLCVISLCGGVVGLGEVRSEPIVAKKLGVYEYFVDESTPTMFNGRFLMFESIVRASPQWAGCWDPAFKDCACYFRIRDIIKGVIIVNITETCNHAFGAALVTAAGSGGGMGGGRSGDRDVRSNRGRSGGEAENDAAAPHPTLDSTASDTFYIFGTPWIRPNSPDPSLWRTSRQRSSGDEESNEKLGSHESTQVNDPTQQNNPTGETSTGKTTYLTESQSARLLNLYSALNWSGPCSVGNCSVHVFSSSDPALQQWAAGPGAPLRPGLVVYNNDVTFVNASAAAQMSLGLPPHRWIMVIETSQEYSNFLVSNGTTTPPHGPASGWVALDSAQYYIPKLQSQVGACPTIRFIPSSGYYYVLTGGDSIYIVRSRNLRDWELGRPQSAILSPSPLDCVVAPSYFGNYTPTPAEEALIKSCGEKGFGDDSDVDVMEWEGEGWGEGGWWGDGEEVEVKRLGVGESQHTTSGGRVLTLLQYGSGNQATFGFSNLALANASLADFLASYF